MTDPSQISLILLWLGTRDRRCKHSNSRGTAGENSPVEKRKNDEQEFANKWFGQLHVCHFFLFCYALTYGIIYSNNLNFDRMKIGWIILMTQSVLDTGRSRKFSWVRPQVGVPNLSPTWWLMRCLLQGINRNPPKTSITDRKLLSKFGKFNQGVHQITWIVLWS